MKFPRKIAIHFTFLLALTSCSIPSFYTNLGHRAGGDYSYFPENSLMVLEESCCGAEEKQPLQNHHDFVYLEFDVRETADHKLVVYHDSTLRRLMDSSSSKQKINNLKLREIKSFNFEGWDGEHIPTLEEFVRASIEYKLIKPMVIEIKNIYSDQGMEKLLQVVRYYNEQYANQAAIIYEKNFDFPKSPIILMCFRKNLPKPIKENPVVWQKKIKEVKIDGIFQAKVHQNRLF